MRPLARRRLPPELRPDRIGEIAARFAGGLRDPGFTTLLQRVDQTAVLGGNRVDVYFDGSSAFDVIAILHAKTVVADDYASLVGSNNLDFRSFHLNAECNFLVLDDEVGRTMSRAFERDLELGGQVSTYHFGAKSRTVSIYRKPKEDAFRIQQHAEFIHVAGIVVNGDLTPSGST